MLLANLAVAYDWSGEDALGARCWESAIEQAPDSLRDALHLLSLVNQVRQLLHAEQPVELTIPNPETAVEFSAKAIVDGQVRYPSSHHALAELHCLMMAYWSSQSKLTDQRANDQINYHRRCALESIEIAKEGGFYNYGNRWEQLQIDPLFNPLQTMPEWDRVLNTKD
ncbi:MAG TPA: hypothetical protein PKD64_08965 [Pirellulaceae bacterium]|nr:hypothetical protein [Pirellulaceae bacterium]HMO92317.1 hypothetical protein [Pirellulaceae bacterium]HMP69241.1 hypothetical protein [Pirellulaceae bacterium]